jgi:ABC-type transport system substrate-binding protein
MSEINEISVFIPAMAPHPSLPHASAASRLSFLAAVLGQLVYLNSERNLAEGLLQKWSWDASQKMYILELKHDLFFHNGRKVNSKDLEFSLLRPFFVLQRYDESQYLQNIEGVASVKPGAKYQSGMVSGVRVLDDYSVGVTLKTPNPHFIFMLARSTASLLPQEELEEDHLTWKNLFVAPDPIK